MSRKTLKQRKHHNALVRKGLAKGEFKPVVTTKARPFHLFQQNPRSNKITWLRVGSARLGRALRAAKEAAKYSKDNFFVAYANAVGTDEQGHSIFVPEPEGQRYYSHYIHPAIREAKKFNRKLAEEQMRQREAKKNKVVPIVVGDITELAAILLLDNVRKALRKEA